MGPAGALNALVHAPKVRFVFLHRTCPNYPGGLRIQVCTCILHFGHLEKKKRKLAPQMY